MTNPLSPDDTLQRLLSRRKLLGDDAPATEALEQRQLHELRNEQLSKALSKPLGKPIQPPPPIKTTERAAKGYWFSNR